MTVSVSGKNLVIDGNVGRLRGCSYSGFEFVPIQGWSPSDPSGAQAGQPNGPNYSIMRNSWNFNVVRIPLNQAAWLGQITYDTAGLLHDADPQRNYKSAIQAQVTAANAAGLKVILDLHWSSPGNCAPMKQQLTADADNSVRFWASVAATFKNNQDVLFEVFNEPILFYAIRSGGTGFQVLKSGGVMDYADCDPNGRQVRAMTLTSPQGHFRPGSIIAKGGITATVQDHDVDHGRLYYHSASGTLTSGAGLTVQTRATKPLISRGVPVTASSGTAVDAIDANYDVAWRSSGAMPANLTLDLSSKVGALVDPINSTSKPVVVAWYSEATYEYEATRYGSAYYNLPQDYTLQVNPAAGGTVPTSGWVTVVTVTGNTLTGRQHVISLSGYNWLRFNCTAIRGSPSNTDCQLQLDVWAADDTVCGARATSVGTECSDGILFVGDSIMAGGLKHGFIAGISTPAIGETIAATTGHRPPTQCAGMPNWTTANFLTDDGTGTNTTVLENWLKKCPLRYVTLAIGANDAGPNASPSTPPATYVANMLSMAAKCRALGKFPIIPTITYSTNAQRNANVIALNNAMAASLATHPEIIVGPDQYAYYQANPTLISGTDFLHPTNQGYSNLRSIVWGGWCANTLYSPTATIANPDVGWNAAGMQSLIDAIRTTAAASNVVVVPGISYDNDLSGWAANAPGDTLGKMCVAWHPYPPVQTINGVTVQTGGSGYAVNDLVNLPMPNTVYARGQLRVTAVSGGAITGIAINNGGSYLQTQLPTNPIAQASSTGSGIGATFNVTAWANQSSQWSMPVNRPTVESISNTYPVICTEIGEHNETGTVGSPWITDMTAWADSKLISGMLGWTWDVWGNLDNVLIKDGAGTPTDGYGVTFRNWSLSTGSTSISVSRGTTFDSRVFVPYIKIAFPAQSSTIGVQSPAINCAYYIAGGSGATWSLVNKPAGMGNPDANGLIAAWTPTGSAQTYSFQITCTNSSGSVSSVAVNWVVAASGVIPFTVPNLSQIFTQGTTVGSPYDLRQHYVNQIPAGETVQSVAVTAGTGPLVLGISIVNETLIYNGSGAVNSSSVGFDVTTATPSSPALADWQTRIAGTGVVWYHKFDSAAEVNAFRWTPGYGNDPNAVGSALAGNCAWVSGGGFAGGGCLQITRPTGVDDSVGQWWRPFSPIVGAANGRGVNDPGANGTLPAQAFNSSFQQQTQDWSKGTRPGWYGHSSYASGTQFDGTDFWIQIRGMVDPRRSVQAADSATQSPYVNQVNGKGLCWITTLSNSQTDQELVTLQCFVLNNPAGYGVGVQNFHNGYQGNNFTSWSGVATNQNGTSIQLGSDLGNACDPYNHVNTTCWAYAVDGTWDTLLYHITPGLNGGTGADLTHMEIWAAHQGQTSYTKIWDFFYSAVFSQGTGAGGAPLRNGWDGLLCSTYNNGFLGFSQPVFWQKWSQIIFSKQTIPCPQV